MPELLEVELYRRSVLDSVGHRITDVELTDPYWCRDAPDAPALLLDRRILDIDRRGKVLLVVTDGPTLALRFGMTGRLVVAGRSAVPDLAYGAHGDDPRWTRFRLATARARSRRRWEVSDPRRLGRMSIDPDLSALGPDAWGIDAAMVGTRLRQRSAPVKAVLLDQAVIAGLGNLLADEVLLRAGIAPTRSAASLSPAEVDALTDAITVVLPELLAAGGSHQGRLAADRRRAGEPCPIDGAPLTRTTIGGRSSYWCPAHQR